MKGPKHRTATVAVAVALSLLSGTGVFLMEFRAGRLNATLSNFLAEALTAVTAGLMALFLAKYKGFDVFRCPAYPLIIIRGNDSALRKIRIQ